MSGSLQICSIENELQEKLKRFRFQKSTDTSALILKIMKETQCLVLDEELTSCSVSDIRNSLPDNLPRFIVVSYKLVHADNRVSFPLCVIFLSPQGCNPEVQMLYAGTKSSLVKEIGASKDFELRDLEDLNDELLLEKLL